MFSTLDYILQVVGSMFILGATTARSLSKKHMVLSSACSVIGGVIFTLYAIKTGQWGILPLNILTTILGLKGVFTWRK